MPAGVVDDLELVKVHEAKRVHVSMLLRAAPRALQPGRKLFLKHTTHTVQVVVTDLVHRLNVATLETVPEPDELAMNDLGEIRLRSSRPLVFDSYAVNRLTGSFILIDQGTNATVAAGMLLPPRELVKPESGDYAI